MRDSNEVRDAEAERNKNVDLEPKVSSCSFDSLGARAVHEQVLTDGLIMQ